MARRPIELLQEFSLPLIAGVIGAVLWANVEPHSYHVVSHGELLSGHHWSSLHFFFNDIFMALFFGVAAKEITEACLPGGSLNPPSKAVNPLFATAGGVLGPVGVYFAWTFATGDSTIANGWGIPTATDIALAWLVARLAFGKGHPAISFLLLLAVADDGLGLGIIAIFYPDPAHPVAPSWLALVGAAMVIAYALRKRNVHSFWPYVAAGGLSWAGLYFAHLHPALALVPVVPFMPNQGHDEGLFYEDENPGHDTLNHFEHFFKLPVDLGLFGFGLVNAGVELSSMGNATWAVLVALLVGKTVGIFGVLHGRSRGGLQTAGGHDLAESLVRRPHRRPRPDRGPLCRRRGIPRTDTARSLENGCAALGSRRATRPHPCAGAQGQAGGRLGHGGFDRRTGTESVGAPACQGRLDSMA